MQKDRVPSPSNYPGNHQFGHQSPQQYAKEMYYRGSIFDENADKRNPENQYYFQKGNVTYQTLPSKRTQYFQYDANLERSVTPDITRGLERNSKNLYGSYMHERDNLLHQKLGIPVKMPDVSNFKVPSQKVPLSSNLYEERPNSYFTHISPHKSIESSNDSIKISPIDPRNSGGFQSSTPSAKTQDLKAAVNLENRLLSPKKSTMSNEELYAVIHKSKKKMNISTDDNRASPVNVDVVKTPPPVKSPETGYIGDKSRSRLSWSPSKGEYVDFNTDIDKLSPPNESRSRQSWACSDRKGLGQTSRLDFKKLLLQKSNVLVGNTKKLSAVEQLKLSKDQVQKPAQPPLSILELSGSPRSLVTRKFANNGQSSPRTTPEKPKPAPKLMSPRSQWRFANPRSDVLSSTILEDCREDESPNNSMEKKKSSPKYSGNDIKQFAEPQPYSSISQRLQAQRAQFFTAGIADGQASPKAVKSSQYESQQAKEKCSLPTLETAF